METIISTVMQLAYKVKPSPLLQQADCIDLPLTGTQLKFKSVDMCYLFLEICAYYRIRFDAEDLLDHKFITIRSISEILSRKTA